MKLFGVSARKRDSPSAIGDDLAFAPGAFGEDGPVASDRLTSPERARRNEETFANANEQIRARAEQYEFDAAVPFLCECSDVSCTDTVPLSLTTYREARTGRDGFILLPGHHDSQVERIVDDGPGYVLVEKFS